MRTNWFALFVIMMVEFVCVGCSRPLPKPIPRRDPIKEMITAANTMGDDYLAQGRYDSAIKELTRAIDAAPQDLRDRRARNYTTNYASDYAIIYTLRGTAFLKSGLPRVAIKDLTEALYLDERNAEALRQRGSAYLVIGRTWSALEDCEDAIRLEPENAVAYHVIGKVMLARNDYAGAIVRFEESIKIDPKEKQKVNKDLALAYYRQCVALGKDEKLREALEILEVAKKLDPDARFEIPEPLIPISRKSVLPQVNNTHYKRGLTYLKTSDYDHAIDAFTAAIRNRSHLAEAYYHRGTAFLAKGFVETAIRDFTDAISVNRRYAEAYSECAHAHFLIKDFRKAEEDSTRAIRLKPRNALAFYYRGRARWELGKYRLAAVDFREAVRFGAGKHGLDPTPFLDQVTAEHSNYRQEWALIRNNRLNAAIEKLTTVIQGYPNARAYYARGVAFLVDGSLDAAVSDLDEAIRRQPNFAEAYCKRGRTFLELGKSYRTIRDCTKAVRLKPALAEAYSNRGIAYLNDRKPDRAVNDLNRAIRLRPKYARDLGPFLVQAARGSATQNRLRGRAYYVAKKRLLLD